MESWLPNLTLWWYNSYSLHTMQQESITCTSRFGGCSELLCKEVYLIALGFVLKYYLVIILCGWSSVFMMIFAIHFLCWDSLYWRSYWRFCFIKFENLYKFKKIQFLVNNIKFWKKYLREYKQFKIYCDLL